MRKIKAINEFTKPLFMCYQPPPGPTSFHPQYEIKLFLYLGWVVSFFWKKCKKDVKSSLAGASFTHEMNHAGEVSGDLFQSFEPSLN